MLKLFQFPRAWPNVPNPSPFCIKVETYLRLAKIPYEVVSTRNLRAAPKKKFPYIIDNGVTIGDSSFIIDYLKKQYGDNVDNNLTPQQRAFSTAIQRLVEEHLYWLLLHARWVNPSGWEIIKEKFFGKMPIPHKWFVPKMIQRKLEKDIKTQGVGRHSDHERAELGKSDIDALSALLGDQDYFFGQHPTSVDASVWGLLTVFINTPLENPLQEYVKSISNLMAYDKRMHALFESLKA